MTLISSRPVVVAPMAGGPSTPALVAAAARAGAAGFLAAGYKTAEAVGRELAELRDTGLPYGLNIFVPSTTAPDPGVVDDYRRVLRPEADRYGVALGDPPLKDDDGFAAKVELAAAAAVPMVSFTFGLPAPDVLARLRSAGCRILLTVTDIDEARRAAAAGADVLIVQSGAAGGHSATTTPRHYRGDSTTEELVRAVARAVDLPLIGAGGTGDAAGVRRVLAAGAVAVQAGTAFLLADEAGTRAVHREALLTRRASPTVVTRAFTGQPARALPNRFTEAYSAVAPVAYPAVHHLTAPIRAAGDPEATHLWAGTAHAAAISAPAAEILDRLC
jgi:nitronate monooxygenase